VALYENLLVFAAILQSLTLLRLARRRDAGQRGYLLLIFVELAVAGAAMVQDDRFLGAIALCLCGLTVALPWLLERAARRLFALGRPRWGVRLTGLRALLMPGAGLWRQQQILAGFALLDARGAAAALAHFRALLAAAEDPAELAMLHEQIVATLVHDLRWSEAVAHYESQFQPGFAALRPALALGLLRAYGELDRLEAAAKLLHALEDGPIGQEPGAAELLGQARLTFLAYAGATGAVDAATTGERGTSLGLSPASAALMQAVAARRAGDDARARALLQTIPGLLRGRDARVGAAARAQLEQLSPSGPREPGSSSPIVEAQVLRSVALLQAQVGQGGARRVAPGLLVTTLLIAVMAGCFLVALWQGLWGVGLLRAGAFTPELWRAGSWGRLLTAPFVHGDLLGLLLDCYSIWLGGHVFERIQGHGRMGLVALGGAAAGLWATGRLEPEPALMLAGGNAMAVAVLVATLWTLVPMRTPGVTPAVRRSLVITLLLLLGGQLLACLPGEQLLRSTPLALGAAALVASLVAIAVPPNLPRLALRALDLLLVAALGLTAVAAYRVAQEDPIGFAVAHRDQAVRERGAGLALPLSFTRVGAAGERRHALMPVYQGWLDVQALRGGALVQVMVVQSGSTAGTSALFRVDPGLLRELAIREDEEIGDEARALLRAGGEWSTYTLQRNGEAVARVIERPLAPGGPTVVLVAAPPAAFEQAPQLYARIVADAALTGE
jgi:membrane associated rhomboid family serine protease